MADQVAVVFTAKTVERILREGGTSSWHLDPNHARQCAFALCTRNAHNREEWAEKEQGPEEHRSAFLVAKVRGVAPSPEVEDRYLIQFSDYARVNIPDMWKGERNPVKYTSLADLGINPSTLKWEPMPKASEFVEANGNGRTPETMRPLTIAEAKQGLALMFGIPPEAIDITIRG